LRNPASPKGWLKPKQNDGMFTTYQLVIRISLAHPPYRNHHQFSHHSPIIVPSFSHHSPIILPSFSHHLRVALRVGPGMQPDDGEDLHAPERRPGPPA